MFLAENEQRVALGLPPLTEREQASFDRLEVLGKMPQSEGVVREIKKLESELEGHGPDVPITRNAALGAFYERYSPERVSIGWVSDVIPSNCHPFAVPQNCWFISFCPREIFRLNSSSLVGVSKETGEIVYEGSANDEG